MAALNLEEIRRRSRETGRVRANRKALRFPGGEGVMPPAVWGLQPCYSFPTVTHGSPTPLTATCFLSSFTYFLNLIKPMRVSLEWYLDCCEIKTAP